LLNSTKIYKCLPRL